MDHGKSNVRDYYEKKLKSYSEVESLNRLSHRDMETASTITAGGDNSIIDEDLEEGGGAAEKGKGGRDS